MRGCVPDRRGVRRYWRDSDSQLSGWKRPMRVSGGTSEHPLLDDELHKYTSGPHPHQLGVVSKSNAKWQPLSLEIPKQLLPSLSASGEGWGLQLLDPRRTRQSPLMTASVVMLSRHRVGTSHTSSCRILMGPQVWNDYPSLFRETAMSPGS